MAQKDFTGKFFPIANANASEVIPGAIIHMQTRNGEDEAIVGAGAMVYTGGDPAWVPVDQNNPIEARVRELEARIGEVSASPTANTLADRLRRIEEKLALLESGNAKMQLTGSAMSVEPLTTTPLQSGQAFESPWKANDGRSVGLIIEADTVVTIELDAAATASGGVNVGPTGHYRFTVNPISFETGVWVPPIRIGPYYRWRILNLTGNNQTMLHVYEVRQYAPGHRQSTRQVLAYSLEIRDTGLKSPFNTPQRMFFCDLALLGDGTHPIFVRNTHDQQVNVIIRYTAAAFMDAVLGTFQVPAGAVVVKTNADFPGLDVPTLRIYLEISASAPPTTGMVEAYTVSIFGG